MPDVLDLSLVDAVEQVTNEEAILYASCCPSTSKEPPERGKSEYLRRHTAGYVDPRGPYGPEVSSPYDCWA